MNARELLLLAVFLYLAGGFLALLCNGYGRAAIKITGGTAFLASLAGIASAVLVLGGDRFQVVAPGWFPFTAFVLNMDALAGFFVLVISLIGTAASLYSLSYLEEYAARNPGVLGFLYNTFIASMILVVTAGDAFYFLIFWEVMTLTSYFLVVYEHNQASLKAGFLYFLVAHAGTCLIMASFLLFFAATGSFNFSAFRGCDLTPVLRSCIFILAFIGFAAKAGAVPLHFWLPGAHSAAPSNVSALLSGVMIKTAVYGIIRVTVDLLGPGPIWWGVLVLALGAVSAFLGIAYALAQQDLKKLLAYSSVENIGIILMGVGLGITGLALGKPVLALTGLLAGLYHLINHASFKGLLFMGAGSVLRSTHTRDLEKLGGLARLMPLTALLFLTGAICVSALPPLNGFVSEWFVYQSLFNLGLEGGFTGKLLAPLFAVVLAMTGALTAMCFVKAYGIAFAGPPRSAEAGQAREVPFSMIAGKGVLAISCLILGIGAPAVAPQLAAVAGELIPGGPVAVNTGLAVHSGSAVQGLVSPPLIALLLVGSLLLPLLLAAFVGGGVPAGRTDPSPWACGYGYRAEMSCTSRSFAQPLQVIFRPFYLARTVLKESEGGYFPLRLTYNVQLDDLWEHYLGRPLVKCIQGISSGLQALQMGNVRLYCCYIILVLVILLTVISI